MLPADIQPLQTPIRLLLPSPPKGLLSTPRGPSRLVFRHSFPAKAMMRDPQDERRLRVCLEGVSRLASLGYGLEEHEDDDRGGRGIEQLVYRRLARRWRRQRFALFAVGLEKVLGKIRAAGHALAGSMLYKQA